MKPPRPLSAEPPTHTCVGCGSPLAHDQRYCITCGTRRGPLPTWVDAQLAKLRHTDGEPDPEPLIAAASAGADDAGPAGEGPDDQDPVAEAPDGRQLPSPRAVSMAVMAMLVFGVIAGSLTGPGGVAGLAKTFVVDVAPSSPPTSTLASAGGGGGGDGGGGGGAQAAQTITETITQKAPPTTPGTNSGGGSGGTGAGTGSGDGGGSGSAAPTLPAIQHVFVIMLGEQGYTQAFTTTTGHPYLSKTLRKQGELLQNYYGVAPSPLSNAVALISGQGPTPDTAQDCPQYVPVVATPGGSPSYKQVQGDGCIYPSTTQTLADELVDNGSTWKAYIQGVDQGPAGQPTSCRHPAAGAADPNQASQPTDPYVTWRNPFAYFDSLTTGTECSQDDVGLGQLATDLKSVSTTPNFAYIAPDPCDDGSDQPCTPGAPAGLAQSDAFLKSVVPKIEASPAYKQDGMIVITFDQAPVSGPDADTSSCCDQPTFPNLGSTWPTPTYASSSSTTATGTTTTGTATTGTTTSGTTTTGTTTSGTTSTTPTAPASPPATSTTSATTPATGTTTTTATTPTSCPTSGTTTSGTTTTGTTPTTGTSTTGTTPTTSTPATSGTCSSTPLGGGQVGALLISKYVTPNSEDAVDPFNHFSLLKTIEDLFSLQPLGYAADPALPEFDSAVFNAQTQ